VVWTSATFWSARSRCETRADAAVNRRELLSSIDFQTGGIIAFKFGDETGVASQERLDHRRRLVAAPEPDDLWRRPQQPRHFDEIDVERDEGEFVYP